MSVYNLDGEYGRFLVISPFVLDAIGNRFNFISFRPLVQWVLSQLFFLSDTNFYFRPTSMAKRNSVFRSLSLSSSLHPPLSFCNLQSYAIFKNEYKLVDSYRKAFRIFLWCRSCFVSFERSEKKQSVLPRWREWDEFCTCNAMFCHHFFFFTVPGASLPNACPYWKENKFSLWDSGKGEIAVAHAVRSTFFLSFSVAMKANFAASFIQYIWRCVWLTRPFANTA